MKKALDRINGDFYKGASARGFSPPTGRLIMTYTVELAINRNGKFAGWQIFEGFLNKRLAWDFIKSHGYTHADKDICWMAYSD